MALPKGYKHTKEAKKKISDAGMGHKTSEETRKKIGKANKGKKFTEEHKRKLSEAGKGKKLSEETKKKLSDALKGKMPKNAKNLAEIGKKFRFVKGFTPWNKGKKWLEQTGENSPLWKGGKTPLIRLLRTQAQYRQWRSDVFTRDEFTCQECSKKGKDAFIEAHHIKSFAQIIHDNKIETREEGINCEELWNINNGITLCHECHKLTDNYKNKKLCN